MMTTAESIEVATSSLEELIVSMISYGPLTPAEIRQSMKLAFDIGKNAGALEQCEKFLQGKQWESEVSA